VKDTDVKHPVRSAQCVQLDARHSRDAPKRTRVHSTTASEIAASEYLRFHAMPKTRGTSRGSAHPPSSAITTFPPAPDVKHETAHFDPFVPFYQSACMHCAKPTVERRAPANAHSACVRCANPAELTQQPPRGSPASQLSHGAQHTTYTYHTT
jgi:hypothetical protein